MKVPSTENLSAVLAKLKGQGPEALARILPLVYEELRRLAARHLNNERADHTLSPTALVHEAYLRLAQHRNHNWNSRAHFFAAAACIIRRILVNYAEAKRAKKRGGGIRILHLDDAAVEASGQHEDLLALNEAMNKLAQIDERKSQIVELRVFGGLTVEEVASYLGISTRSVHYDWRLARAWLHREISQESESTPENKNAE